PDPLNKYRWYILGGFAFVLAAGAIYTTSRSRDAIVPDFGSDLQLPGCTLPKQKPSGRSEVLLEALTDEMFQLEVEHKQGMIPQQEYEQAKAALDRTLERAIRRAAPK